MKKLLAQIVAAILGLWLASSFVPGVIIEILPDSNFFGIRLGATWQIFLLLGITLGLLNFFVKPVLKLITLPLRLLTLGLFGLVINVVLIWVLDAAFREFSAPWLWPILITTVIVWALSVVGSKIFKE